MIDGDVEAPQIRTPHWLERVALCAAQSSVLVAQRDSALLIGITDATLVQLVSIAELRIASGKSNDAPFADGDLRDRAGAYVFKNAPFKRLGTYKDAPT